MNFSDKKLAFSDRSGYAQRNFVTHTEAKEILKGMGIKTSREYYKITLEVKKKLGLPSAPYIIYKGKGWVSWADFFGRDYNLFVKLDEAKEIVKRMGINGVKRYRELTFQERRSFGLPSDPRAAYKGKGWTSWLDFFGTNWSDFKEAKKIVKRMGINTCREYYKISLEVKKKLGLPSAPNMVYKGKGWRSWLDFLGKKV